jgi:hypothetical protein
VIGKGNRLPRIYADDRGSGNRTKLLTEKDAKGAKEIIENKLLTTEHEIGDRNKTFKCKGHEGTQGKLEIGEAVVGDGRKKKPLQPRGPEGCVWLEKIKELWFVYLTARDSQANR